MFLGNNKIKSYFSKLIKSEALSHAYIFYGIEGIGKKTVALEISESMAGPAKVNPDLRILDKGRDEIHIADIRELRNFIHMTPFGKWKIAILNNAHNLGHDASNTLLKILEEPPGRSIIFLITHLPEMLLNTVISRCQRIRFAPLKEEEIFNYLLAEKKVKRETAAAAAKLAAGSLGLALELAGDFDNFQKNINLLNRLAKSDFKERFEASKVISSDADAMKRTVRDWLIYSSSLPDKPFVRELLHLNNLISRPQFNHKLFFENFLARIDA